MSDRIQNLNNNEQMNRYARQTSLPEIGEAGQEKLRNAKVLIVGVGGLGFSHCPLSGGSRSRNAGIGGR